MESHKSTDDHHARAEYINKTRALGDQITELAGHINAATYRFLMLIAEFDRRGGWSDGATQSCAHCLNWKCGIVFCAAREKVRTARTLEQLPKISAPMLAAAMARGQTKSSTVEDWTLAARSERETLTVSAALRT